MLTWFNRPTGVFELKFQVRRLNKLSEILNGGDGINGEGIRAYFLELQANPSAHQREISKLSSYYKNLTKEELSDMYRMNNGLLFSSLFCKSIPSNLIEAAQDDGGYIECGVLRILGQKLLRTNQWPLAEKIIKEKFNDDSSDNFRIPEETLKYEIYALNGNFQKMIEQLPLLAKSEIPQEVYYLLLNLLNFKDGNEVAEIMRTKPDFDFNDWSWSRLAQVTMKGKLMSKKPVPFGVFLRQAEALSSRIELEPSLLMLAFNKCEGIDESQTLTTEQVQQLKSILKTMSRERLIHLVNNMKNLNKKLSEDISSTVFAELCIHSVDADKTALSSLLCWIIKFYPEKYSYDLLMTEFVKAIDGNVVNVALKSIGLNNENAIKFIEFCMLEKQILIEKATLKDAIDVACENFGYEPSQTFMKFIHEKGYKLSSNFYLNRLKRTISGESKNLLRAFECFKSISSDSLHGELLQEYLSLSHELLEFMMEDSNLDKCYKIYTTVSKYQILKSLDRPKSFRDFIMENFREGKFKKPFKPTINMECIKAVLDSIQQHHQQKQSLVASNLDKKFCLVALRAALCSFDFPTAHMIRVYMNNCGYSVGDLSFSQNILKQWLHKLE